MEPLAKDNIRLAATLVLVRDSNQGLEVYMVERPGGAVFPNLHVFPGGKVDIDDFSPELCAGLEVEHAQRLLGVPGALRYWVTAIRECFEECGVLLANSSEGPLDAVRQRELASYRQRLIDAELSMEAFCNQQQLTLNCAEVLYFSHWLTPESAPKRFDTRFFLAPLPSGQVTQAHATEVVGGTWVAPQQALANADQGQWQMISPTKITLQSICAYADVTSLCAAVLAEQHLPELDANLRFEGMHDLR